MNELINKLNQNGLIDDIGYIILETYDNGLYSAVDTETFQNMFGSTNYTYTALVNADQGKGYTKFFNTWKDLGIL